MATKIAILLLLALGINLLALSIIWAHHEFVSGLNPFSLLLLLLLLLALLTPPVLFAGKRLTRYLSTIFILSPALLFTLGALILATAYIADGLLFGHSVLESGSTHSYFGPAGLYIRLLFIILFLVLAGAYHFFPVLAQRTLNPALGYVHFMITLVCAYLLSYPVHYIALASMPRSYIDISPQPHFDAYTFTNNTELILLAAQALFLVNIFYSTKPAQT